MRGSEQIDGLSVEKPDEPPVTLKSLLTRDELAAIEGMRGLDKDTRRAWLKIGKALSSRAEAGPGKKAVKTPANRRSGMRITGNGDEMP